MRNFIGVAAILLSIAGCAADRAPLPASHTLADFWVFFDHDSSAISSTGTTTVEAFARYVGKAIKPRIILASHTDRSGSAAYNLDLSLRRGEAIRNALVDLGVSANSITVKAFGEAKPLIQTADGVNEPQNRRVELLSH